MKKIIWIFGGDFPESTFEFVRLLHEINPVLLMDLFFPPVGCASLWNYPAESTIEPGRINS
jgi:hypothetical protein